MKKIIPFLLSVALLSSCLKDEGDSAQVQLQKDIAAIDNKLTADGVPFIKHPSGVRMVISVLGESLPANANETVNVDYVGRLFSGGNPFDQGNINGPLSGYILGWQVAFTTLPAGSVAKIYIPSGLGYGQSGQGSIPGNSILVFDVTFNNVVYSSGRQTRLTDDISAIDAFLETNEIEATIDPTGVRYVIDPEHPGEGNTPSWYDGVKIKYKTLLLTDETVVINEGEAEPTAEFYSRVIDYIHALKIGLQKMPAGSKARFYVPSTYGFGGQEIRNSAGTVIAPANSNLIIDLELISINP